MSEDSLPSSETAAERVRRAAADASERLDRAVAEAPVLDRIPGRSLTLAGLGAMAAAIALSFLPGFYGVGLVWSVVMLAGGALVAVRELRAAGRAVPGGELPAAARHPLLGPAFAALVSLHAIQLLSLAVVPLLWLAAALLLAYDQHRKAAFAASGLGGRFDLARAWHGHRRWISLGAGVCLGALFLTWGSTSGSWSGGLSYDYAYRTDSQGNSGYAYGYDYHPLQHFWPGYEVSGRNQPLVIFAEAALLALVLWAALRRGEPADARQKRVVPAALLAALFCWWWLNAQNGGGVWLFALGWAAMVFGVVRLGREEEGRLDPAHLAARARSAVAARRGGG